VVSHSPREEAFDELFDATIAPLLDAEQRRCARERSRLETSDLDPCAGLDMIGRSTTFDSLHDREIEITAPRQ